MLGCQGRARPTRRSLPLAVGGTWAGSSHSRPPLPSRGAGSNQGLLTFPESQPPVYLQLGCTLLTTYSVTRKKKERSILHAGAPQGERPGRACERQSSSELELRTQGLIQLQSCAPRCKAGRVCTHYVNFLLWTRTAFPYLFSFVSLSGKPSGIPTSAAEQCRLG